MTPADPRPPSRLRLTAYAAWQLALFVPSLLVLIFLLVGGVLAIIMVGLLFLLVAVPSCRWIADEHRRMAANVLGTPIPNQYRPTEPGIVGKVTGWARDPMTWRDLGWLVAACTVGFAASLIAVLLLILIVTGAFWYYGIEPLMRARSYMDRWMLSYGHTEVLEQRVQRLTETRADAVDHSAAELRRIERDLHDGAQARLVAMSMSLGMAESLMDSDPETAQRMISEARSTSKAALGELRSVVRGIHPPVLADRGLAGAVEALSLDMAIPVRTQVAISGRPPAPVESAVYFAVAECLANIGKHSAATNAWLSLTHGGGLLRVTIGDDGRGGADPESGTGMRGVMRRLSAFDGTMRVSSPPCDLSSPRTTPSSGPA
jgi:signal transduction histidine kinase